MILYVHIFRNSPERIKSLIFHIWYLSPFKELTAKLIFKPRKYRFLLQQTRLAQTRLIIAMRKNENHENLHGPIVAFVCNVLNGEKIKIRTNRRWWARSERKCWDFECLLHLMPLTVSFLYGNCKLQICKYLHLIRLRVTTAQRDQDWPIKLVPLDKIQTIRTTC